MHITRQNGRELITMTRVLTKYSLKETPPPHTSHQIDVNEKCCTPLGAYGRNE